MISRILHFIFFLFVAALYDLPLLKVFGAFDAPFVRLNKDVWEIYSIPFPSQDVYGWASLTVGAITVNIVLLIFIVKHLFRSTEAIIYTTEGLN